MTYKKRIAAALFGTLLLLTGVFSGLISVKADEGDEPYTIIIKHEKSACSQECDGGDTLLPGEMHVFMVEKIVDQDGNEVSEHFALTWNLNLDYECQNAAGYDFDDYTCKVTVKGTNVVDGRVNPVYISASNSLDDKLAGKGAYGYTTLYLTDARDVADNEDTKPPVATQSPETTATDIPDKDFEDVIAPESSGAKWIIGLTGAGVILAGAAAILFILKKKK